MSHAVRGGKLLLIYFVFLLGPSASQDRIQLESKVHFACCCVLLSSQRWQSFLRKHSTFSNLAINLLRQTDGLFPFDTTAGNTAQKMPFPSPSSRKTNPSRNFLSCGCWPFKSDKWLHIWVALLQTLATTCFMVFHWISTDTTSARGLACKLAVFLYIWKAKLIAGVFLKANTQAKEGSLLTLLNLQLDSIPYFKVQIPWSSEKIQQCMTWLYGNAVPCNYYCLF